MSMFVVASCGSIEEGGNCGERGGEKRFCGGDEV